MYMRMSVIPVHVTLTHKLHMHILHGTSLEPKQMHLNLTQICVTLLGNLEYDPTIHPLTASVSHSK